MKKIVLSIALMVFLVPCQSQDLLYDFSNIQELEIYFGFTNWDYQMDTAKAGSEGYIMADSVIINGITYDSVGLKYKGNSSYSANNNKNPIHIKLDHVHKKAHYDHCTDLKLGNGFSDPSFIREFLSYSILKKYMDCPKANFANVYINGQLRGLYSNVQSIDERFNGDHYFSADGSFFKCNPVGGAGPGSSASPNLSYLGANETSYYSSYELESNAGWSDLVHMIDTLNNFTTVFENSMDIDRAIWMLAFNVALVNLDSYSGQFKQNYYLYKDHNNLFLPTIWDLNMSFGGFPGGQTPGSNQSTTSVMYNSTSTAHPLISKLLAIPRYKHMYIAHMKTIMDECIANGWYVSEAQSIMSTIDAAVTADPYKFYTYTQFNNSLSTNTTGGGGPGGSSVPGIQLLMDARNTYLQATNEFQQSAPTLSNPLISNAIDFQNNFSISVESTNNTMVWLGYRFDKTQRFTKIQLQDDGLSDDGTAGDGRYGALINANGTHVEYYFFADNNNAGIFLPARAEHEFFNKIFNTQGYAIGDISINELLASNSIQLDEYAEDDDWIELYNNSNNIINLQGLFLTDDGAILNKWPLPSLHIAPHGFSMVWADDDAWQLSAHTNFKLSAAGGTLMLTDGTNILDNIIYPIQQSDVSYGRFPDGSSGSLQFMSTTFNGNNSGVVQVEENKLSFSIYPNPTNDILNISTNKTIREIKIINGMGQMMNTAIIKGNNTIVNVGSWADGVYHISLEMEDGEILHRSFVKG
jgi:hypothetical protein